MNGCNTWGIIEEKTREFPRTIWLGDFNARIGRFLEEVFGYSCLDRKVNGNSLRMIKWMEETDLTVVPGENMVVTPTYIDTRKEKESRSGLDFILIPRELQE